MSEKMSLAPPGEIHCFNRTQNRGFLDESVGAENAPWSNPVFKDILILFDPEFMVISVSTCHDFQKIHTVIYLPKV